MFKNFVKERLSVAFTNIDISINDEVVAEYNSCKIKKCLILCPENNSVIRKKPRVSPVIILLQMEHYQKISKMFFQI